MSSGAASVEEVEMQHEDEFARGPMEGEMGETPPPPKRRPVKKEVAGAGAGAGALIVAYIAQQIGLPMDGETAGAFALVVGSIAAYLKSEDVL